MSGVLHGVIASLAGRVTDAFWKYVSLLLNTSATNGAQNNTFLDSSTNNFSITRNGDTTQGSFNPYMPSGYWSGFFDGTGDYLSIADNAAFDFAASDFTVETWVNFSALPAASGAACFVSQWPSSSRGWFFYLFNSAGTYQLYLTYSTNGSGQTNLSVNLASAPTIGTWNHVAFVRSGNNFLVFWNGTQVGSTQTLSATIFNSTGSIVVGAQIETTLPDYLLVGYQSNLRIVKGTAVYTAAFTPPTTPLTAITNTSLLCLQDNRFIDNSTNAFAITRNGDTRISKFAPFNPPASYSAASYGGSGYFDGNGDELALANNAAFEIGNGDFSYEAWVFATRQTNTFVQGIISYGVAGATGSATCSFQLDPSGYLALAYATGVANTIVDTTLFPINQWVHAVACRSGSTLSLFVNGTRVATATTSATVGTGGTMTIGGQWFANASTRQLQGYISNARVLKGSSAYNAASSTITVPTTPLTAITNTSLLLNFTNAGIFDAATINNGQTVGNAQVSTTQAKWSPTSMAFDGTGDYLTVIDKPELRFGTAPFTIEFWLYFTSSGGSTQAVVSKGTTSTGWQVQVSYAEEIQFVFGNLTITSATITPSVWTHVAVVREGTGTNQTKIYVDGTNTGVDTVATNFNQTNPLYVGASRILTDLLYLGYVQDLRITNGVARYTANFTAPTAAFPTL
jgi:hypothetical protein